MLSFQQLRQYMQRILSFPSKEKDPAVAYNLWSETYDHQPDNLVLAMEKAVFTELLKTISIPTKIIADIGCGTGRHWEEITTPQPGKLIGFDVSEGMLTALREKYPLAETYLLKNNFLQPLDNESCNIVVSTLALAHIKDMKEALKEWNRVLKMGGDIIITDYHPAALVSGGDRTFRYKNKLVAVKSYVHTLESLRAAAKILYWTEIKFVEEIIDEKVKHYYANQNALQVFEKFKNMPIIYGIHFKKTG